MFESEEIKREAGIPTVNGGEDVNDWNPVFDLDDFCRGLPLEKPAENWPEGWLDTVFNSFNT